MIQAEIELKYQFACKCLIKSESNKYKHVTKVTFLSNYPISGCCYGGGHVHDLIFAL